MAKIERDDAERIRIDAQIAEDMMQRIQKEARKTEYVGAYYIREKAQEAMRSVEFILATAQEYIDAQEAEK